MEKKGRLFIFLTLLVACDANFKTVSQASAQVGQTPTAPSPTPTRTPLLASTPVGAFRPATAALSNLEAWTDEQGQQLQATSLGVIADANLFYMYGVVGTTIVAYQSVDLTHWNTHSALAESAGLQQAPHCAGLIGFDAPSIIFNASTGQYTLFARAHGADASVQQVAVAVSPNAAGTYIFKTCFSPPSGQPAGNLAAFADTDGSGYLVTSASSSGGGSVLTIDKLSDDFMSVAQPSVFQAAGAEQPIALFKSSTTYYLLTDDGTQNYRLATSLASLAQAELTALSQDSVTAFGMQCAHVMQLRQSFIYQCRGQEGNPVWLPLNISPPSVACGSGCTNNLKLHWRDAWEFDPNAGVRSAWHNATAIDAAALSANNVGWQVRGNALESSAAASLAVADSLPAITDGTWETSIDPGTAQSFSLIFRHVSDSHYSSIIYDHGAWSIASDAQATLLLSPAPLSSGFFHRMALGFHANNVALTVDNQTIISTTLPGPVVAGTVGLGSKGLGAFLATNARLIDANSEGTSYSATFLSTFTLAAGLLVSDPGAWSVANRVLTGSSASMTTLVDTESPTQADGSLVVTLDNGSHDFAILMRYVSAQQYIGIMLDEEHNLTWQSQTASGRTHGALASNVLLKEANEAAGNAVMSIAYRGNRLRVALDGVVIADQTVDGLPTNAGYVGLLLAPQGSLGVATLVLNTLFATPHDVNDDAFNFNNADWLYDYAQGSFLGENHFIQGPGHSYNLDFTGSTVATFDPIAGDHGIMIATIDNGPPQDVDLYAANRVDNVEVFRRRGLNLGPHNLNFDGTSRTNPATNATFLMADRIVIPRVVDDSDMAMQYTGDWTLAAGDANAFAGTLAVSHAQANVLSLPFVGTEINIFGVQDKQAGGFDLSIDNIKQASISAAGPHADRANLATVSGLAFGEHVAQLSTNSNASLSIDAVEIMK